MLDLEAAEKAADKAAERTAARDLLLEQLEREATLVKDSAHPLIEITYGRLTEEKDLRLAQLAKTRQRHELEIDRRLDADTEATWRRWAVSTITSHLTLVADAVADLGCSRYTTYRSVSCQPQPAQTTHTRRKIVPFP